MPFRRAPNCATGPSVQTERTCDSSAAVVPPSKPRDLHGKMACFRSAPPAISCVASRRSSALRWVHASPPTRCSRTTTTRTSTPTTTSKKTKKTTRTTTRTTKQKAVTASRHSPWSDRDRRLVVLRPGSPEPASADRRRPLGRFRSRIRDRARCGSATFRRAAPHPGQNPGVPVGGVGYV